MSEPFVGQIKAFGFNFAPRGWALCNGQLLPINSNQALFSLLGTTYGGNGVSTFALPDLRGRAPLHFGTVGGSSYVIGEVSGTETHSLTAAQMPSHTHIAQVSTAPPSTVLPGPAQFMGAVDGGFTDAGTSPTNVAPAAIATQGASQPHNNMQPYQVINYCIALEGIFPSRN